MNKVRIFLSIILLGGLFYGISGFFACAGMNSSVEVSFSDESQAIIENVGLRADENGNLYIANASGIMVFNPIGEFQYRIEFPTGGGAFEFAVVGQKIHVYVHRKDWYYEFLEREVVCSQSGGYEKLQELYQMISQPTTGWQGGENCTYAGECEYQKVGYDKVEKFNLKTGHKEIIKLFGVKTFPLPIITNWLIAFCSMVLLVLLNVSRVFKFFKNYMEFVGGN